MRTRPKLFVPFCLALALAAPWPAMAQPSGGGGGGGGQGPASSPPSPQTSPDSGPPRASSPPPLPQETALEAVQDKRALPLADIVTRNGIVDQLIAAKFVLVRGQLVYQLKLLSVSGQLRVLYFQADTGTALQGD